MSRENYVLFSEKQYFRQVWLWFIILICAAPLWFEFYRMFKEEALDAVLMILVLIAGVILPALFFTINLKIEIHKDGIYFRFFPVHLTFHKIALAEIQKHQAVTYDPIKDCGGWGIRWYGARGKSYTVSGYQGIRVDLYKGDPILFGTQRPEEFALALGQAIENNVEKK